MIQLRITCELTLCEAYGSGVKVGYSLSAKLTKFIRTSRPPVRSMHLVQSLGGQFTEEDAVVSSETA
jgi:hypothetical protein